MGQPITALKVSTAVTPHERPAPSTSARTSCSDTNTVPGTFLNGCKLSGLKPSYHSGNALILSVSASSGGIPVCHTVP